MAARGWRGGDGKRPSQLDPGIKGINFGPRRIKWDLLVGFQSSEVGLKASLQSQHRNWGVMEKGRNPVEWLGHACLGLRKG